MEHKMCVLVFPKLLSETFLDLRRNERNMIKNVYCSLCKVPVILVRLIKRTGIFSTDFFFPNAQIQHFVRIRPVRAELFHAMVQTDRQT